ncbi:NADP-dependent oxidoreductase [Dyadobacter sp. MSC1_007]|jgi:NADPH:quinone reductase-like Zn-dependent oxidoreductase|uniref:NADP-dependent oxidoreductase n=1 Tax=Dyadobacter sp. MSC1_007 TaxID=2909264 RepID=UPI00202EEB2E|nr:NADP-dependent oxidoreductase [Dyadobacter sp. MSC1_007]
MKAFIIDGYKPKNGMRKAEVPNPVVGENDVLVRVHAAGVNLLDSKIKTGDFKAMLPYKFPLIMGHDVAGEVVETGSRMKRFKVGDAVYARPADFRIGTFAELIAVREDDLAIKPSSLSMEEAASIPLVGLTVWQALVEKAKLKSGQKVFIQAGSGGVGTFAIQLAKHLGATVATTTSAANMELVKSLGADVVIDYRKEDFETILKDYDVVLNSQDATTLEKSLRILKPGGKLISISGPPDTEFAKEIGLNAILKIVMFFLSFTTKWQAKRLGVDYSFLFMRAQGSQLGKITELINAGIIRPVMDKIFPFDEANEALAYVESGRAKGKVVIKVV